MTVWGDVGKSPRAWDFAPFRWPEETKVDNQAQMVSLGRPGVGEQFLRDAGSEPEERVVDPATLESTDPELFARSMASSGPAYEAIQNIGEEEFLACATELAHAQVSAGLAISARIQLFACGGVRPWPNR